MDGSAESRDERSEALLTHGDICPAFPRRGELGGRGECRELIDTRANTCGHSASVRDSSQLRLGGTSRTGKRHPADENIHGFGSTRNHHAENQEPGTQLKGKRLARCGHLGWIDDIGHTKLT